jgi:hypothetical protein
MRQYQRLFEESRKLRLTIADALEVLREATEFKEHHRAEVRIGPLQLPSGEVVGLVDVLFDVPSREKVCIVSLPTAARFRAIMDGTSRRDYFEISRLDGAVVDDDTNVLLADGTKLRAVEVIPTRLPVHPSEIDWLIVHCTISIIGAETRCYRSLRNELPPALPDTVPDRIVDCSRLPGLHLDKSLKHIIREIGKKVPILRRVSSQTVANALRKFGIRIPMQRPRRGSNRAKACATGLPQFDLDQNC